MILHIDDTLMVGDLQDKFSRCFPALKIAFYAEPHGYKEASANDEEIESTLLLSAFRKNHNPRNLIISSSDKVRDVESRFRKCFGLHIQILHKVNGVWTQTSQMDNRSLKALSSQPS